MWAFLSSMKTPFYLYIKPLTADPPLLMRADAFLHEGVLVGIEQEVELPPRGHGDQEGPLQEVLSRAVASHTLHEPPHVRAEVLHVCHSGRHGHLVEAEQSQRHPTQRRTRLRRHAGSNGHVVKNHPLRLLFPFEVATNL